MGSHRAPRPDRGRGYGWVLVFAVGVPCWVLLGVAVYRWLLVVLGLD